MKKISTPKNNVFVKEKIEASPSKSTLDFLKMFARVYYVDKNVPASLSKVIVN